MATLEAQIFLSKEIAICFKLAIHQRDSGTFHTGEQ
jgi:hypothetical protein